MNKMNRPSFEKSFRGYNRKQIDEYVAMLESEIEISGHHQEKNERELSNMRTEVERLKNQLNNAWSEAETMRSKNSQLTANINELETSLKEVKEELAALKIENTKLRESAAESEHNPQIIKDAILSAQRMSEIIVQEANQRADELRTRASEEYAATQEEMDKLVVAKYAEVDHLIDNANQKCADLQREYDHILMDVSGFKAEMISLYRRHLELLYMLPDNGMLVESAVEVNLISDESTNPPKEMKQV